MSSEEYGAEARMANGIEAYQKHNFDEAAEHFEKAAAWDPGSLDAHLALGATRLTLYQRRPSPTSSNYLFERRDIDDQGWWRIEKRKKRSSLSRMDKSGRSPRPA